MSERQTVQAALAVAVQLVRQGVLEVDSDGQIRRRKRADGAGGFSELRYPLRLRNVSKDGYLTMTVDLGDKRCTVFQHHLVYVCSHGPLPPGARVEHVDGNKLNNHPSNLRVRA